VRLFFSSERKPGQIRLSLRYRRSRSILNCEGRKQRRRGHKTPLPLFSFSGRGVWSPHRRLSAKGISAQDVGREGFLSKKNTWGAKPRRSDVESLGNIIGIGSYLCFQALGSRSWQFGDCRAREAPIGKTCLHIPEKPGRFAGL